MTKSDASEATPGLFPKTRLPGDFGIFIERCNLAAHSHPDMPVQLVVLSRLYGFVANRMEEVFDRLVAPWDLNAWHWLAMMVVYARSAEEITPTDISRSLVLARANVTRVTDELVKRGLLHREPSTRDRRVLRLTLTPAGHQLVDEIKPHAWKAHQAIWSALDPQQLEGAADLLSAIAKGIESWTPAEAGTLNRSSEESA